MIESDRVPGADSLSVTLGDQPLHYLRAGDRGAPPIVLLHGSGIDDAALSWRHVVPALAENYRVYALDWPGYGDSPAPATDEPDVPYLAGLLRGFLEAIELDRPVLIGISMGAAAAIDVALERPEAVSGLGLVSSYGLRDVVPGGASAYLLSNTPFAAAMGRQFAAFAPCGARAATAPFVASTSSLDDAFFDAVSERLARSDAGDAWMAFQRCEFGPGGVRTHFADRLSELSAPTLFVHGDSDPLIPVDWAREAAVDVPGARLSVIEDCGHWPPRECPSAFLDALVPWLDGL